MQRLTLSLLSIVASTSVVHAQATPPADPAAPPVAPADPAAAPPVEPTPPPPPVVEVKPAEPKAPEVRKLTVAKDSIGAFFQPGINIQGQFVYDTFKRTQGTGATAEEIDVATSTFRLRRLEVSASGDLVPKFATWRIMFDLGRTRDTLTSTTVATPTGGTATIRTPTTAISPLQDFFVTFPSTYGDVTVGQFKNPISWEGYAPSSRIVLTERSFLGNTLGGQRDVGIKIEKTFKMFKYVVGVYNGSGQNNVDTNNQKDVGARLEVYPIPGLTLAAATYDSVGYRTRAGTKDRWEGDVRYEANGILFQGEYIRAVDVFTDGADKITAHGFYALLGYTLKGVGSGAWKGDLQPVVRVGGYDPNVDVDVDPVTVASTNFGGNDERYDFEGGLNYYLRGQELKLQLSYDRQQFLSNKRRTAAGALAKPAINEVIAMVQLWF